MKFPVSMLLIFFPPLVACGGGKNEAPAVASAALAGNYASGCYADTGEYIKVSRSFSGNTVTENVTYHTDAACAAGSETILLKTTAAFSAGESVVAPVGATKFNLTNIKSYVTAKSDAMVATLNASAGYGKTGWVKNTEKEVTGFNSDGTAASSAVFDIFKVTNATICFGDFEATAANDGSSDTKRPVVLETGTKCFTKQ